MEVSAVVSLELSRLRPQESQCRPSELVFLVSDSLMIRFEKFPKHSYFGAGRIFIDQSKLEGGGQ